MCQGTLYCIHKLVVNWLADVVDDENGGFNKGAKVGAPAGPRGLSAYQFASFLAIYDLIWVMKVSNLLSATSFFDDE